MRQAVFCSCCVYSLQPKQRHCLARCPVRRRRLWHTDGVSLPQGRLIYGPSKIEIAFIGHIRTEPACPGAAAAHRSSVAISGVSNRQLDPVCGGRLPSGRGGGLPELKRVSLRLAMRFAMRETLEEALTAHFGQSSTPRNSPTPLRTCLWMSAAGGTRRRRTSTGTGIPQRGQMGRFGEELKALVDKRCRSWRRLRLAQGESGLPAGRQLCGTQMMDIG
jgi:hypothetical protein